MSTALATVIQSLTTFGLTKLISVGEFGAWREFVLFAGFTGVLHLGFADGLQVSWCRTRDGPLVPDVRWALKMISVAQVSWIGIAIVISIAFPFLEAFPFFVTALALYALFSNASTALQYRLQCTGRFTSLGWFVVAFPGTFLMIALGLVLANAATALHLALGYCLALGVASLLILPGRGKETTAGPASTGGLVYAAQVAGLGLPILALNYSVLGILNFDKIAASLLYPAAPFALYGFAAALLAIINSVILGSSRVMLPTLAHHAAAGALPSATVAAVRMVTLVWAAALASYFPAAMAVKTYLPQYAAALPMTNVFFIGSLFLALPQIVHLNACRALRIERKYLKSTLVILGVALPAALLTGHFAGMRALPLLSVLVAVIWTACGTLLLRTHNVPAYDRFTLATLAWAMTAFLLASSLDNLALAAGIYLSSVLPLWLIWYRKQRYG